MSGSDCGHCYIWHKRRPDRLEAWLEADAHVVNCLEPHPFEGLTLATSGIDDSIKIWAPIAEEPVQAGRMADRWVFLVGGLYTGSLSVPLRVERPVTIGSSWVESAC